MPRTLPIGEAVRRRAEVLARIKAKDEQRKELRRKEKAKKQFRKWSNRWHLRKYHERTAFLVPLREELKRLQEQHKKPELRGLPASRYRKLTPEIRDLCIQSACIEFDTNPVLLVTPLRYAPDARTKEIIYLVWWLALHKFHVSIIEIARHYQVSAKTVLKYTQDAQYYFLRDRDHPLSQAMRRLIILLDMFRAERIAEFEQRNHPVPRELLKAQRKNRSCGSSRCIKVETGKIGRNRYQYRDLVHFDSHDAR
jgi:hypothetical protein